MIGNAYVDPSVIPQLSRPFYNFGLIEQEQLQELKPLVDELDRQVAAKNSSLSKVVGIVVLKTFFKFWTT